MRHRQLGSSDLQVSEIALGSWLTYGSGVDDTRGQDKYEIGTGRAVIDVAKIVDSNVEIASGDVYGDRVAKLESEAKQQIVGHRHRVFVQTCARGKKVQLAVEGIL